MIDQNILGGVPNKVAGTELESDAYELFEPCNEWSEKNNTVYLQNHDVFRFLSAKVLTVNLESNNKVE